MQEPRAIRAMLQIARQSLTGLPLEQNECVRMAALTCISEIYLVQGDGPPNDPSNPPVDAFTDFSCPNQANRSLLHTDSRDEPLN